MEPCFTKTTQVSRKITGQTRRRTIRALNARSYRQTTRTKHYLRYYYLTVSRVQTTNLYKLCVVTRATAMRAAQVKQVYNYDLSIRTVATLHGTHVRHRKRVITRVMTKSLGTQFAPGSMCRVRTERSFPRRALVIKSITSDPNERKISDSSWFDSARQRDGQGYRSSRIMSISTTKNLQATDF